MNTKTKSFVFGFILILLVPFFSFFSGCGVIPCAWVKLDMEGYIVYTSYVYPGAVAHIYLYENEEDAEDDTYHTNAALSVTFYPRILGADTVDGVRTTTVDVSSWNTMEVIVYKDKSVYVDTKDVYLNGEKLTATNTYDSSDLKSFTFDDITFVRGNPGGTFNKFVNAIEYK